MQPAQCALNRLHARMKYGSHGLEQEPCMTKPLVMAQAAHDSAGLPPADVHAPHGVQGPGGCFWTCVQS